MDSYKIPLHRGVVKRTFTIDEKRILWRIWIMENNITDAIKNIVDGNSYMGVCEEYIICEECPSYDNKTSQCIFPNQIRDKRTKGD